MGLVKCPDCGQMVSDRTTACLKCGGPIVLENTSVSKDQEHEESSHPPIAGNKIADKIEQGNSTGASGSIPAKSILPIKWLMYWMYFSLPLGGFVAFIRAIIKFGNGGVEPTMLLAIGVLQCATTWGLLKRRLWGWSLNWVALLVTCITMSFSNFTYFVSAGVWVELTFSKTWPALWTLSIAGPFYFFLSMLLWMLPNFIYWRKRRGLFTVDSTKGWSKYHDAESQDTA